MLSFPKASKYSKNQKGKSFNKVNNILLFKNIKFNSIRLVSLSSGRLKATQLSSVKMSITKNIKKLGKIYFVAFPHNPITKKPLEIRMGKGKGNVDHWAFNASVGISICEIQTTNFLQAYKALKTAQHRLPIKTKIFYN